MIVVYKLYDDNSGADPVLVYDGEREELWGNRRYWESSLNMVGLSEEEFARFFETHTLFAAKTDEDPFEDIPNAEDWAANYPPGTEEIPDLPTPEPRPPYDPKGEE